MVFFAIHIYPDLTRYLIQNVQVRLVTTLSLKCYTADFYFKAIDAPAPKSQLKDVIGHEQAQPTQPSQVRKLFFLVERCSDDCVVVADH